MAYLDAKTPLQACTAAQPYPGLNWLLFRWTAEYQKLTTNCEGTDTVRPGGQRAYRTWREGDEVQG